MMQPPTSLWGGQAGALLAPEAQRPGVRAVTERGEHGVLTGGPGYSIRWGAVPLDGGSTPIRLDDGVETYAPTPRLYAELRGPDPRRIPEALPWSSERDEPPLHRARRMSAPSLYRALLSDERSRRILGRSEGSPERRAARVEAVSALLAWAEANPTHPDGAELADTELLRLRYAVLGAHTAFERRDQEILDGLRPDWVRDYRVGDTVAVLQEPDGDDNPGWTLEAIDGSRARLRRGGSRREAMLWRLRVDQAAPRLRLDPKQAASLDDLLEDNLALPYTDRWDARRFSEDVARALRDVLPGLLRGWLGEVGLDLTVTRSGDVYTLRPRRGALSPAQRATLQAHLPAATWTASGAWVRYTPNFTHVHDQRSIDLQLGATRAERLAMMAGEALRAQGFGTSRMGEERRIETARACEPVVFELKGHGTIRVDCGDPGDPEAWHSLYVRGTRYAWGGGRWLRNKVPPLPVLEAVRERGIRVFG